MRAAIQQQLLELNRRFYATVAEEFDRTRQGLPEGMTTLARLLVERLPVPMHVLDVGCGNGRFARALALERGRGAYTGIDNDDRLLALAASQTAELAALACRFFRVDIAQPEWTAVATPPYDAVACLAVLHHFPGYELRRRLLADMVALLAPHGLLALSTWQFFDVVRFMQRSVTWEAIGLRPEDVEPGDALLTWNQGAHAVRYVHNLDVNELEQLAVDCKLAVVETFRADGKEGNLNLFVIAARKNAA